MKVLIGNFHNGNFGGGEFYTYQVAKAVSAFSEVLFVREPNKNLWASNPALKIPYKVWGGKEEVDAYVNFNHFTPYVCNTAKANILSVFFPNRAHKVADYDKVVSICAYSNGYVKSYWGIAGLVCQPYSNDLAPGHKKPNTIVSVGNFFMEPDGHSKNQHVLIEAFKTLGPGWKLTLIGSVVSPEYVAKLKQLTHGLDVEIIPNASEKIKTEVLASSEFYWHANGYGRNDPYQTEHFGIAPEEALKSGCLAYVHASGGAKDFCASWDTVPELVRMTKQRSPNKQGVEFQTPEKMELFWKGLLEDVSKA